MSIHSSRYALRSLPHHQVWMRFWIHDGSWHSQSSGRDFLKSLGSRRSLTTQTSKDSIRDTERSGQTTSFGKLVRNTVLAVGAGYGTFLFVNSKQDDMNGKQRKSFQSVLDSMRSKTMAVVPGNSVSKKTDETKLGTSADTAIKEQQENAAASNNSIPGVQSMSYSHSETTPGPASISGKLNTSLQEMKLAQQILDSQLSSMERQVGQLRQALASFDKQVDNQELLPRVSNIAAEIERAADKLNGSEPQAKIPLLDGSVSDLSRVLDSLPLVSRAFLDVLVAKSVLDKIADKGADLALEHCSKQELHRTSMERDQAEMKNQILKSLLTENQTNESQLRRKRMDASMELLAKFLALRNVGAMDYRAELHHLEALRNIQSCAWVHQALSSGVLELSQLDAMAENLCDSEKELTASLVKAVQILASPESEGSGILFLPTWDELCDRFDLVISEARKGAWADLHDGGFWAHVVAKMLSWFRISSSAEIRGHLGGTDTSDTLGKLDSATQAIQQGNFQACVIQLSQVDGLTGLLVKDWLSQAKLRLAADMAAETFRANELLLYEAIV